MSVTGTYAGTSSYVYQVQVPSGATNQIQWRKFAKGATPAGAYTTARSLSTATSEGTALALDQGVKVYFAAGNTYTENTKWEFTADKGHSFSFQEVGRTFWNGPVEITGTEQVLSGGVSVRFDALSGYNKDDHFIIRNRTIDAYGTYSGFVDEEYTVEIVGATKVEEPILAYGPGSLTTGLAAQLTVSGTYSSKRSYVYEVVVEDVASSPNKFKWRRYLPSHRAGGGPYHAEQDLSLNPVALDYNVSVAWGATTGQSVGDTWTFTARKGETFKWKKASAPGTWSRVDRISGVGEPVDKDGNHPDPAYQISSHGIYTGAEDAEFVAEVLRGGTSFRWRKGPLQAALEELLVDTFDQTQGGTRSGGRDGFQPPYSSDSRKLETNFGPWSGAVNILAGQKMHLQDGVHLKLGGPATPKEPSSSSPSGAPRTTSSRTGSTWRSGPATGTRRGTSGPSTSPRGGPPAGRSAGARSSWCTGPASSSRTTSSAGSSTTKPPTRWWWRRSSSRRPGCGASPPRTPPTPSRTRSSTGSGRARWRRGGCTRATRPRSTRCG